MVGELAGAEGRAMMNTSYSLEEMPVAFDGMVQLPVICDACYHALNPERGARSHPKSYAALATSKYRYQVQDWKGLGTTPCRCCGSSLYSSRFSVEVHRR
jgi:hypothetical protein